jgi:hypothetical protein
MAITTAMRTRPQAVPGHGLGLQLGLWAATTVIIGAIYLIYQLPRNPR